MKLTAQMVPNDPVSDFFEFIKIGKFLGGHCYDTMVGKFYSLLYSAYQICDELTIVSSAGSPFAGFITGLIMGDVTTGLFIGGSFCSCSFEVIPSVVLYRRGAVLATAFYLSRY